VVAAPSGAGKSTITRALLQADPNLALSISVTTRAPRPGEQDGVHYYFHDHATVSAMRQQGDLLESAQVFDHIYGTPRAPVEQALQAGQDMLFDIDWQGHRLLRAALPNDVLGVFLLPPSLAALETRLRGRGDPEASVIRRMEAAVAEISHWREFDYVVVNDDLDRAIADIRAILQAGRLATSRRIG
jgi:guanylate kinase